MQKTASDGGRKPRVTDDDLLDALRATDDPVLSTAEVADKVPIQRRGVLNRLRELEEAGEIDSKTIGGRNTVWWIDADTQPPRDGRDPGETPATDQADESPEPEPSDTHGTGDGDLREQLAESLPGQGEILDRRAETVIDMYHLIQDADGSVQTAELKELVDADRVGYADVDSFWTNAIKKNSTQDRPNSLTQLPDIEHLGNGQYEHTAGDQ